MLARLRQLSKPFKFCKTHREELLIYWQALAAQPDALKQDFGTKNVGVLARTLGEL